MTDQEIVEVLRLNDIKGGRKAFKAIYLNNYYMIEDFVTRNSGTKEEAKDLFQDSIIVLYKNLKKESFTLSGKISTYLYSISRNLWLKKIRDHKVVTIDIEGFKENFVEYKNSQEQMEYTENQKMIGSMLQQAGERCEKILRAFYYEKLSMKKIAQLLDYSSEQVAKNQKLRCLKKIRSVLNKSEAYYGNLENKY